MTRTLQITSSDGIDLAVHVLVEPAEPVGTLLFCHATGFHGRVWRAVADDLADHRCIAVDHRGYGDSARPDPESLTWRGFADDVASVVDHLALDGCTGVGHSMGGGALILAEEARPGTFDRLVCFEPIVFPPLPGDGPRPNPLADGARHRRTTFDSRQAALDRFSSRPTLGALRPDVLADYVDHGFRTRGDGSVELKADPEIEARTYEMAVHHDGWDGLPDLRCPVTIVWGGDGGGPAQIAPRIAERIPSVTAVEAAERGHFGPLERPDWFAGVIRAAGA